MEDQGRGTKKRGVWASILSSSIVILKDNINTEECLCMVVKICCMNYNSYDIILYHGP